MKDLLNIEVNEKEILPQDVQVEGFDNVAVRVTVPPDSAMVPLETAMLTSGTGSSSRILSSISCRTACLA